MDGNQVSSFTKQFISSSNSCYSNLPLESHIAVTPLRFWLKARSDPINSIKMRWPTIVVVSLMKEYFSFHQISDSKHSYWRCCTQALDRKTIELWWCVEASMHTPAVKSLLSHGHALTAQSTQAWLQDLVKKFKSFCPLHWVKALIECRA